MHQFGFIRLCAATPPCRVANPRANAAAILALPNVDGALVGGASLVAEDFLAIARAAG